MAGEEELKTAGELVVRWGNLDKFFGEMEKVGAQSAEIEKYAVDEVFNKTGFDYSLCALQPLADVMDELAEAVRSLRTTFDGYWVELTAALAIAAKEFEAADGGVAHAFLKPYLELAGVE